ncbi:hypothetical protein [Nostoc sp. ChiVER01]|uniref:hypothetical protein n=1 Tax=Nostoc sp. ChiVER01 TaxID=3075382 RepID=UPI002AD532B6|nr:hypothetical protein [Nostoc sp. ChiVER01]MDZ8227099.1 hypothetical protein [Nostoc sp. ChiVER01]
MVSKQFSFRLPDKVVQALYTLQLEGESLNQTAQRILTQSVELSTGTMSSMSTGVDNLESLIDKRIEESLAEVRSQLEAQLEELRGKLRAR